MAIFNGKKHYFYGHLKPIQLSQAKAPAGISVAEVEALVLSVAGEVTGHSVDAQATDSWTAWKMHGGSGDDMG